MATPFNLESPTTTTRPLYFLELIDSFTLKYFSLIGQNVSLAAYNHYAARLIGSYLTEAHPDYPYFRDILGVFLFLGHFERSILLTIRKIFSLSGRRSGDHVKLHVELPSHLLLHPVTEKMLNVLEMSKNDDDGNR